MKTHQTVIILTKRFVIAIILVLLSVQLFAASYETISSGLWSSKSTWKNNSIPPTTLTNGDVVTINHIIEFPTGTEKINNGGQLIINVRLSIKEITFTGGSDPDAILLGVNGVLEVQVPLSSGHITYTGTGCTSVVRDGHTYYGTCSALGLDPELIAISSTITASRTSINANGVATSIITVQLKNSSGSNVTSGTFTVIISTTRGSISATSGSNGTYIATLTSSSVVETATLRSTVNGSTMNNTATVAFVAPVPSSTHSTIVATDPEDDETSNIAVQLRDADNVAITTGSYNVVVYTTFGTLIQSNNNTSNGIHTATLTSTSSGSALVTARINGNLINDSETVSFSPLPITLMSFTGTFQNDKVVLNWVTTEEINNDRFEVERSTDGVNFEVIGTVYPNTEFKYSFEDANYSETNYYRFTQYDFNGQSETHRVIVVNAKAQKYVVFSDKGVYVGTFTKFTDIPVYNEVIIVNRKKVLIER